MVKKSSQKVNTIQWAPRLATRVNEIDEQHKGLFEKINHLTHAYNKKKNQKEITDLLNFLEKYAIVHFDTEEQFMRNHNYPETEKHIALHLEFIRNVLDLKSHLVNDGVNRELVKKTNEMVIDWWIDHIIKVDKALGDYLKALGV